MKNNIRSVAEGISTPKAEKRPELLVQFEDERIDNYYWLRERKNEEVIQYLESENAYRQKLMAHLQPMEKKLFDEITNRIVQTDMSVPFRKNGYHYLTRYEKGMEHPIHSRKKEINAEREQVLLNVNQLAEGQDYYAIGGRSVSPDNQWLAYGEDLVSRRIYTLKFKNLTTGLPILDEISGTTGGAVWANDNRTVYYTLKDDALRGYKIMRHHLGTNVEEDVLVYHEKDEAFHTFVYKSMTGSYIIIGSSSSLSTEYRILKADDPTGEFVVFHPREANLEYHLFHDGERWLIRHNLNAPNFKLSEATIEDTSIGHWIDVVDHEDEIFLEDLICFKSFIVLNRRIEGNLSLEVMAKKGEKHLINFEERAYTAYIGNNAEYDDEILRLGFTSLTTPATTYDYHMQSRELTLRKQQEVVGDFTVEDYLSERIFIEARDGVEVPVSIVYHKEYKKEGTAPLLLYAYGSYGHSMDPYFSPARLSLLGRGFAFAIAHVRGGQEKGRQWYEDGKFLKKTNTFKDFIDVGEALIQKKYCAKDQLFAMGGSAGGLLMGAVMNMAPELWRGVIAAVPFVDVLTTMLDESIPLTVGEFDEWGNPKEKDYYHYIKAYSPIDNLRKVAYPATLITTGLHDSQVQYWEPAKWIAKLRDYHTGEQPLLLFCNMTTGHGGASGRFARYKEVAMEYAFLLDLADRVEE